MGSRGLACGFFLISLTGPFILRVTLTGPLSCFFRFRGMGLAFAERGGGGGGDGGEDSGGGEGEERVDGGEEREEESEEGAGDDILAAVLGWGEIRFRYCGSLWSRVGRGVIDPVKLVCAKRKMKMIKWQAGSQSLGVQ